MKKHIKVYYDDDSDFKKRLDAVKGPKSDSLFGYMAIEAEVNKLEKQRKGR